ncbi:MAG: hypothetical protein IPG02_18600 [Ignavibacteria bacterium]|nr:hypothetical protein [Ignavibacteria bacterium]MBK6876022.1 hypothetical protein [Ignavibacteria bacterium]
MPSELQTAKTFFLVSGIINILGFLGWGTSTVIGGAFSCGLGCIVGILPVLNIISSIMDFIAYNKLNTLNRTGTYSTIQTASVFQIVTILTGNVVSFVFGIINLNNIGRDSIKLFLQERGIY